MHAKSLNALLAVAVIALALLSYSQSRTIRDLRSRLEQPTAAPASVTRAPVEAPPPAAPAAPPVATAPAAPARDTAAGPADRDGTATQRVMREFVKMMENPQMNEVMKASQRATLEVLYKDLLDAYQLSPEEREHFMDLLMARQMFRMETGMKMMGGTIDGDERQALADEMKEYDQVVKTEIDTFLNDRDDSAAFEFYEKTMQERMVMSGLKAELVRAQTPLADGIDRQLIDIMAKQKAAHTFRSNLGDERNQSLDPARFSRENIQAFEKDLTEVHAAVAAEARTILTAGQLAAFTRTLQQMRQMQISQLNMAASMFAGRQPDE